MAASAGVALLEQSPFQDASREFLGVKPGAELFRLGERAECFYMLISGVVKLYDRLGSEESLCRVATPGMVIGEEGAFLTTRRTTARAADACQVVELRPADFGDGPKATAGWRWLADRLERQAAQCHAHQSWIRNCKVEERIIRLLAFLAVEAGDKLPLSQGEIGSLVGATRETSSTLLNRLERRGLVKLGRGIVTIPSVGQLRQAAGS